MLTHWVGTPGGVPRFVAVENGPVCSSYSLRDFLD
jgi:hypothetical protein